MTETKRIVVTGDLILDYHLVRPTQPRLTLGSQLDPTRSTGFHLTYGGAWLLSAIVRAACSDLPTGHVEIEYPAYESVSEINANGTALARGYDVFSPHMKEIGKENTKRDNLVWRVETFFGCQHPTPFSAENRTPDPVTKRDYLIEKKQRLTKYEGGTEDIDILVLSDDNLGFRDNFGQPKCDFWKYLLQRLKPDGKIVMKVSSRLCEGELWKELIANYAHQLTVVVDATMLRSREIVLSNGLSWDRNIKELNHEFQKGKSKSDVAKAARIVVYFKGCGVAIYSRYSAPYANRFRVISEASEMTLDKFIYHAADLEGMWHDRHPGRTYGDSSYITGAIVRHLLDPETYPVFVACGRALGAIRLQHLTGAGDVKGQDIDARLRSCKLSTLLLSPGEEDDFVQPISEIFHPKFDDPKVVIPATSDLSSVGDEYILPMRSEPAEVEHKVTSEHEFHAVFAHEYFHDNGVPEEINLLEEIIGSGRAHVLQRAMQIVEQGDKELNSVPMARYGKYRTVDKQEIERLNELRRLMIDYRDNDKDVRPLSLAVFGPPGSGKSFAIKQLTEHVFADKPPILEFNLSQFSLASPDLLMHVFHQVRDASIKGAIPLVFWDEFDAESNGWLKYFLTAMQDASFRSEGINHPLGKAIFVFAGGTCKTMKEFEQKSPGEDEENFRLAKGPDFVSRLRGYLNIKGPNPPETDSEDLTYLIRRALLIRTKIEELHGNIINSHTGVARISEPVTHALLNAGKYTHGARSLESILSMSRPETDIFTVSSLPSQSLLTLHVSPDFHNFLTRTNEFIEDEAVEAAAKANYDFWQKKYKNDSPGWNQLLDKDKEAARVSARYLPVVIKEIKDRNNTPLYSLDRIDLTKEKADDTDNQELIQIPDLVEIETDSVDNQELFNLLNQLAKWEHKRWLRTKNGWECGTQRNEGLRINPDVCPWIELNKDEQRFNRQLIQTMLKAYQDNTYYIHRKQINKLTTEDDSSEVIGIS